MEAARRRGRGRARSAPGRELAPGLDLGDQRRPCERRWTVGRAPEAGSWGPGWRERRSGLHAGMGAALRAADRAGASFAEARRAIGLGACRRRSGVAYQRGRGRSAAEPAPGLVSSIRADQATAFRRAPGEERATTRPAAKPECGCSSRPGGTWHFLQVGTWCFYQVGQADLAGQVVVCSSGVVSASRRPNPSRKVCFVSIGCGASSPNPPSLQPLAL